MATDAAEATTECRVCRANSPRVFELLVLGRRVGYFDCPQPIKNGYLLTGPLEPTNESNAIGKIAGIKLCESYNRQYGRHYVSVIPTNPNDNYDFATSRVLSAPTPRSCRNEAVSGATQLTVEQANHLRLAKGLPRGLHHALLPDMPRSRSLCL